MMTKFETNFYNKIGPKNENGCQEYQGTRIPKNKGYGYFKFQGKRYGAHRVAFELFWNVTLVSHLFILPECDNPSCCNPDHLWIGDQSQNMADKKCKGRCAYGDKNGSRLYPEKYQGENNSQSKLSFEDIVEIRKRCSSGQTQRNVAKDFNVNEAHISLIVRRKSWKHVP